jgi:putative effector of murein hydrolase LrgA (UPF0299 family)
VGVGLDTTRIIIFVVTVAAIVIVILVTGWADDKRSRQLRESAGDLSSSG